MTNHTPGPWIADGIQVRKVGEEKNYKSFKNNYLLAEMKGPAWEEKKKANAKLMAAAPELLEAAEDIKEIIDHYDELREQFVGSRSYTKLEEAIQKAKGG